jgi:hypothetical protein
MAQLLRQAIDSGAPPSLARIPMTPEEVASYEEAERLDADDSRADSAAMNDAPEASERAGCVRDGASRDG